jgi:hypothetical protein
VSQVVQELVAQALPLVGARYKPSDIEKLYGYRASAINTCSVVRPALVLEVEAFAGAFYLEVADSSLGVDRGETVQDNRLALKMQQFSGGDRAWRTGSFLW